MTIWSWLFDKLVGGGFFTVFIVGCLVSYYIVFRFFQSITNIIISNWSVKYSTVYYNIGSFAHEGAHGLMCALLGCRVVKQQLVFTATEAPHTYYEPNKWTRSLARIMVAIAPGLINISLFMMAIYGTVTLGKSRFISILNPLSNFRAQGFGVFILFMIFISGVAPSYNDFKGMIKHWKSSLFTILIAHIILTTLITVSIPSAILFSWVINLIIINIYHVEVALFIFILYVIKDIIIAKFVDKIPFNEMDLSGYLTECKGIIVNSALMIAMHMSDRQLSNGESDDKRLSLMGDTVRPTERDRIRVNFASGSGVSEVIPTKEELAERERVKENKRKAKEEFIRQQELEEEKQEILKQRKERRKEKLDKQEELLRREEELVRRKEELHNKDREDRYYEKIRERESFRKSREKQESERRRNAKYSSRNNY